MRQEETKSKAPAAKKAKTEKEQSQEEEPVADSKPDQSTQDKKKWYTHVLGVVCNIVGFPGRGICMLDFPSLLCFQFLFFFRFHFIFILAVNCLSAASSLFNSGTLEKSVPLLSI